MPRPDKPELVGVYRSPDNRFAWEPAVNPSPMRALGDRLQRQTEGLPVLCRWCGYPYWPPMHIREGHCSDECELEEKRYLQERSERDRLLDELRQQETDNALLRGMLGKGNAV